MVQSVCGNVFGMPAKAMEQDDENQELLPMLGGISSSNDLARFRERSLRREFQDPILGRLAMF